jgi:hypothetical protein
MKEIENNSARTQWFSNSKKKNAELSSMSTVSNVIGAGCRKLSVGCTKPETRKEKRAWGEMASWVSCFETAGLFQGFCHKIYLSQKAFELPTHGSQQVLSF